MRTKCWGGSNAFFIFLLCTLNFNFTNPRVYNYYHLFRLLCCIEEGKTSLCSHSWFWRGKNPFPWTKAKCGGGSSSSSKNVNCCLVVIRPWCCPRFCKQTRPFSLVFTIPPFLLAAAVFFFSFLFSNPASWLQITSPASSSPNKSC